MRRIKTKNPKFLMRLIFSVIFATLAFVSVDCASAATYYLYPGDSENGSDIYQDDYPLTELWGYPLSCITNLKSTSGTTWIRWTWTNPVDFHYTMIYLNGTWKTNTSLPYYNATGLNPNTSYKISTRTVGKEGDINSIGVNQTAKTKAENNPPIANFTYRPEKPIVNETITFYATTSTDADGNITNYKWNFGDGNILSTTVPVTYHTYISAGNYTLNLTVTDDDYAMNSSSGWINVTGLDCTCGDICVTITGWYRDGSAFHASITPIQSAVDTATAGDTICVKDGTYNENVDVNKRLTIRSENGTASTTIQGADSDEFAFVVTADYVNITGFTVTEVTVTRKEGIYLCGADHCNISGNVAMDSQYSTYRGDASDTSSRKPPTMDFRSDTRTRVITNRSTDTTSTDLMRETTRSRATTHRTTTTASTQHRHATKRSTTPGI
jgi:PKD repeat protein